MPVCRGAWVCSSFFLASCALSPPATPDRGPWKELHRCEGASFRGISVVDRSTVWVAGSGGTVLRTLDAGRSWQSIGPKDARGQDLRDVHAFGADTAVVMVAGVPARLYRTEDGGRSWRVVHEDARHGAFFDSIAFHGERGVLFGDPIDGAFDFARSDDGGRTWRATGELPPPLEGEAGFAAGGTCVAFAGERFRVVTGGLHSRCLRGEGACVLPVLQGSRSRGAFGLAFRGERGVVVGGDYLAPERSAGSAAWTDDAGMTWHRSEGGAGGYRSGVVWLDDDRVLAVGSGGAALSSDRGRTWRSFGARGFHAIARGSDGSVYACGSDGRIAALQSTAICSVSRGTR